MSLSNQQKIAIRNLLSNKIASKLKIYDRETASMLFLARLIQDNEKIAAYSFIHSMATTLGMSIYEEISVIIASETADKAFRNYKVEGTISSQQRLKINNIIADLRNGNRLNNIKQESQELLAVLPSNGVFQKSGNIADFYMLKDGEQYYFEIKTVKPNIDVFEKSKTKLLEWIARRRKAVNVYLALPYNPYYPEPYERFTEVGMMDPPNDFLIGKQYWNFIGGDNTFANLLAVFDEVGKQFKQQLNKKFKQIAQERSNSY